MNPWIKMVRRFHEKFGQPIADSPVITSIDRAALRVRLIQEEYEEVDQACANEDLVEIADGLCDLIYVCIGTALEYGIDLDPIFEEVQRTNMAKVGGKSREDGKLLKPAGWTPPDIASLLEKQLRKKEKSNGK